MFAQVIQSRTDDEAALLQRMEIWDRDVKPGAEGFLGSTAGVSDDGEFIAIARFESEEAARRNSDRPEQSEWWAETSKHLEGEARFYDSNEVELMWGGGSDDAGFVQVIQGRMRSGEDKARWRQAEADAEAQMRATRPDLIGGISAWQEMDFSSFVYFKSEEEARAGEGGQPEEGQQEAGQWMETIDDLKFIDLRRPFFSSP
jgi:hypothetical protein